MASPASALLSPLSPEAWRNPTTDNYLQRRANQITRVDEFIHNYEREITWCKVKAIAIPAIALIASVVALVYSGAYIYPVFAAASIFMGWATAQFTSNMKIAEEYQKSLNELRVLKEINQTPDLQNNWIAAIRLITYSGVDVPADQVEIYKPLIAGYTFWNNKFISDNAQAEQLIASGRAEASLNTSTEAYAAASSYRQWALAAKVNAAFIAAVMQNPSHVHEPGQLMDITNFELPVDMASSTQATGISFFPTNLRQNAWSRRAVFQEFGDPRADQFVVFKDNRAAPLSTRDVQTLTVQQIAGRVLAAMRLPPPPAPPNPV